MKGLSWVISVAAIVFVLWGCGSKTPSCSDEKTVNLVKQIYEGSLKKGVPPFVPDESLLKAIANAVNMSITTIRTAEHDGKTDKFVCDAVMEVKFPDAVAKPGPAGVTPLTDCTSSMPSVQIEGALAKANIRYTSQMTEDKKEQVVELSGVDPIVNVVLALGMAGAFQPPVQTASQTPPQQATVRQPDDVEKKSNKEQEESTVEKTGVCQGLDLSVTADQLECLDRKYQVADKDLNNTYKQVMARIGESRKESLKKEQISWIKEKTSKCDKAGKEAEGGSLQPVIIKDCELHMTEQRIEYLKKFK